MSETETATPAADFDAGFDDRHADQPAKAPPPAEAPREETPPPPAYVQITEKEWTEIRAAASKTASYDQQFSKLFGTTGNIQKLLNEAKAQPQTARKIEVNKEAFAAMRRDFPELADLTQGAIEAALQGMPAAGVNDADAGKMLRDTLRQRELEILEEDHPDWATIVGQVTDGKPDPDNAFRKWLGTKDDAYQARINATMSPPVIARAIRLFQSETKVAPKAAPPRVEARADRIRAAVQPRGDNGPGASSGNSDLDAFNEGFNSR